ncbi:type II CAAX endopeptidase family protein [Paenibacillus chondroitinus]|uniref:Type II CAAX endopeptidase family protein n=1 Tax=Paenibacillus chondroitinus TaxID=59842 RepID=A0ABU6DLW0_9BACL|nr:MULTISPECIES: type II CAAX endopeptidase family protein [Paenibacillus]MCY9656965.1 CPBP family intramembrane metalloprotease [Paenibacillus anseongense]MEB4798761.1 type II CAAX endopeptidase family protein [Paenibacillus chondroitinus]
MSLSVLTILGKVLLTLVFIVVITVILSIVAAVIAILKQPELERSMAAVAGDSFFIKAALWAQIIGFISGVFLSYGIFERRKGWTLGIQSRHFARRLGEGFVAGALLITVSCLSIWLLGGINVQSNSWTESMLAQLVGGFLLFIGVAVNEELFARGYLQGLVKERFGTTAAITISTLVFAFLHAFNPGMWSTPMPLLNLILAGLLFGVSRELSKGLWMPIGMHLSWNFIQGCIFGFQVSGTPMPSIFKVQDQGSALLSGGSFGAEGSLVTTIILAVGILLVMNYYGQLARRQTYKKSLS